MAIAMVGVLALFVGCANQGVGGGGGGNTNENTINDNGDENRNDNLNDNDNINDNENANENDNLNDNENGTEPEAPGDGLLADHLAAAAFDSIPADAFDQAKSDLRIFYGHTSHGSQLVAGMNMLDTGPGAVDLQEDEGVDLGHEGDTWWADVTRDVLEQPGADFNMVIWSWCGGCSDNTPEGIDTYLDTMDALETEYPDVVFVYMTGHLDGSGESGNLRARNNQIRDYCRDNGKVLYDFADIESYDPDGTYYPDGSDWCDWCEDWCASHDCPTGDCVDDDHCQHAHCFNCYQKGRAFWWMMARLAGWDGE
jgi:hypothetical protein